MIYFIFCFKILKLSFTSGTIKMMNIGYAEWNKNNYVYI